VTFYNSFHATKLGICLPIGAGGVKDTFLRTTTSLLVNMSVNDGKIDAGMSENGTESDITKVGSDLSDDIGELAISLDKTDDSLNSSSMAPLGGVSVAAQRRDEYDINFE
jgi:hypothetical protein